jgi:hypothetical protein
VDYPRLQLFVARIRDSVAYTRHASQSILFYVVSAGTGAAGGYLSVQKHDASVLFVIGITLLGILVPLVVVFLYAFIVMPRLALQSRVADLEQQAEQIQGQLLAMAQDKWGDADRFVPTYVDLRIDIEEGIRLVGRANEEGKFWRFFQRLDDGRWKKMKNELATHPWARADNVYGPLADAFGHFERLNQSNSTRWRDREVRDSDELEVALNAMALAHGVLTTAIDKWNPDTSASVDLDQLELGDGS